MARLTWKAPGKGTYVAGVTKGVVFPWTDSGETSGFGPGYAWNGLTAVSKAAEGGERTELYADNQVYAITVSSQKATGSIEAYDYPKEFGPCFGKVESEKGVFLEQQGVKPFAFVYREDIGDDKNSIGSPTGKYKLTFMFNCYTGAPEEAAATISDTPEPVAYSFDLTCLNVDAGPSYRPVATMVVSNYGDDGVSDSKMQDLEDIIYGTENSESKMPTPEEIITIIKGTTGT